MSISAKKFLRSVKHYRCYFYTAPSLRALALGCTILPTIHNFLRLYVCVYTTVWKKHSFSFAYCTQCP